MRPFFLVGASRSGTTLLRLMLNQHSQLRIPNEAWFLGELMERIPLREELSRKDLQQVCEIILANDRWKDWRCDDGILREAVMALENPTLGEVVDRIFRVCAGMEDNSTWGEKSPRHSYQVEQINQVFPHARFIHLIRDGHDACAAMLKRGWYEGSIRRIASCWKGMVEAAGRAERFGPSRYLEIKFENLVKAPALELRKICAFLEVEYTPELLNYQGAVAQEVAPWERKIHEKLNRSLDMAEIDRHKELSWFQLLIMEAIAGSTLRQNGDKRYLPFWLGWARMPLRALCELWQIVLKVRSKLDHRLAWKIQGTALFSINLLRDA